MQEIKITLRIDFDSANKKIKEPIMLDLARRAAKELITNAMMIGDKRKPQIAMEVGDHFYSSDEIELFTPGEDVAGF